MAKPWVGLLMIASVGPICAAMNTARPVVECGATLTRSTTLDGDLVCGGSGLTIATPGIVLNCAGHTIRSTAPGGIALQVTAPNVTVTNCGIEEFTSGIVAHDASGLKIARSRFSNASSAVRVDRSPQLTLVDNLVESGYGFVSIRDCPDVSIERNEFRPRQLRAGSIVLERSPRSRITGNRSTRGLGIAVWRESDDSVVANNALGGFGRVSVGRSSRVTVRHNSVGALGTADRGIPFGVELMGARDCDVTNNELSGAGLLLFPFDDIDGSFAADGNRVRDNSVEDSGFGILLFGGSRNVVERNVFARCEIAVAAFPLMRGDDLPPTPTVDNDVRRNVLDSGSWGIYTGFAGGNRYEDNRIRGFGVGITELAMAPASVPDVIRNNVISDNGYFGLLAQGASPVVTGNDFLRNGWAEQPPGTLLFPYDEIVLDARGGIGLLPWNGDDAATVFDDGVSSNDVLSKPLIGTPDEPNTFEDDAYADVYSLDTRAANVAELPTSNVFRGGESARVRQDWYGAVRVVPTDGGSAADASVDITDARANPVATFVTESDGVAPAGCDPTRPMGRLTTEENGPTPQWLRITEYVIDHDGNRVESTPHQVDVRRGALSGHATFAWTGCADSECEVVRRYQLMDVTLGP